MRIPDNPVGSWEDYFQSMDRMPVHPLYGILESFLPRSGNALELGSGVGQGAVFLAEHGLDVVAIDLMEEPLALLHQRAVMAGVIDQIETIAGDLRELDLGASRFDLAVAGFVLFFLSPTELEAFWPRLISALKPRALFAGQFLGHRDDWTAQGYTGQTAEEVQTLLSPFEVLHLEEVERDGKTAQGTPKHWHVFHVVARLR